MVLPTGSGVLSALGVENLGRPPAIVCERCLGILIVDPSGFGRDLHKGQRTGKVQCCIGCR